MNPDTDVRSREGAAGLFAGPSEMHARCRDFDWAATPLGPVEGWPATLRTVVRVALASGFPNIVLWGRGLIQVYNDAYSQIIGAKHPYALGRGNQEAWPEVWHLNGPIYERVFRGETVDVHDALYPLARGETVENAYLTVSFTPIRDEAGEVGGVLATMLETTGQVAFRALQAERERLLQSEHQALGEARAAREHLERVISQAPTSMYIARGREHVYEVVNEVWCGIVKRRPEEVLGRSVREAFPEVGEHIYRLVEEVYDTGVPFVSPAQRIELDRGDGLREHFFNIVYQPLRDASGAVYAMAVVANEVTELEAARREAEAANRAKGEFLAVMSHELRTPLNAIGGYAELIELGIHGPVTEGQRAALGRIQHSQRHLLGLINGVLNYSRIEAGAVTYDLADVPVAEAVAEAEALVAPQLRARGLGFAWAGCAPGVAVRADREKLQQILLNLLSNAAKFTYERDGEPGRVEVSCAPGEGAAGGLVLLRVRDTGEGIGADKLASIFEPFVQVDARLTRTREGVGLGLAISRDLARGMGGELTVESTPGVGSTFTLSLPRA